MPARYFLLNLTVIWDIMSCNNICVNFKEVTLPGWLDNYIFCNLEGKYSRSNSDMTVINWGPSEIRNYLGTYFPRSFAESYCIFRYRFTHSDSFIGFKELKLLDFGCGTGGEIIGLATAIAESRPEIKTLKVKAIDGNQYALNRFDEIKDEFNSRHALQIKCTPSAITIDDFYDLSILDAILDYNYDLVISFKAICEFVTKQQFEEKNAYEHLVKFMKPRISDNGCMLLVDVTTKNNVVREWLPDLMDKGLQMAGASVVERNIGNNDTFVVNHSKKHGDISKIAWRLIEK